MTLADLKGWTHIEDDDRVSSDHAGAGHDSDYKQRIRAVISSQFRGSHEQNTYTCISELRGLNRQE